MVANFSIKRNYKTGAAEVSDKLHCKLLGVRIPRDEMDQDTPYYDGERNDIQWVDISGSEYSIEKLDRKSEVDRFYTADDLLIF